MPAVTTLVLLCVYSTLLILLSQNSLHLYAIPGHLFMPHIGWQKKRKVSLLRLVPPNTQYTLPLTPLFNVLVECVVK